MSSQCGYNKFYKKCMYKDCENGRFAHDKRIYKFPLQTDSRHKLWIRNSGNTNLEKWSPTTLRRAGLCEEHFTPNAFNPKSVNKGLKRDAVPIAFDSIVKEDNSKKPNKKRKNLNEQALCPKKNITEESVEKTNFTLTTIINDHDYIISYEELEELEEPPLKTYKPANLHFHSSVDEEDVIEWVHLEPPENQLELPEKVSMAVLHKKENIKNLKTVNKGLKHDAVPIPFDSNVAQNNSKKLEENKKNHITEKINDSEIMTNSLKEENILLKKENISLKKENAILKRENSRLQQVIKGLKYHVNSIITKSEMSEEQNQKTKIIKN